MAALHSVDKLINILDLLSPVLAELTIVKFTVLNTRLMLQLILVVYTDTHILHNICKGRWR